MSDNKPIDVGDEQQVKEQKREKRHDRKHEIADLKELLGTYGGRAFMWRLLEEAQFYSDPPMDTNASFFHAGQRHMALWVLNEVFTADPEAYTIIRNEAASRDAKDKRKKNDGR